MVRVLKRKSSRCSVYPGLACTLAARFARHVLLNNSSVPSLLLFFYGQSTLTDENTVANLDCSLRVGYLNEV